MLWKKVLHLWVEIAVVNIRVISVKQDVDRFSDVSDAHDDEKLAK